jgi:hypothetical protein
MSSAVVSASGVYSVEFDPNFRGARAMSDKAHSMYSRYIAILDAVDSSKLYAKPLDPTVENEIRSTARRLSGGDKDRYESELTKLREQKMSEAGQLDARPTSRRWPSPATPS